MKTRLYTRIILLGTIAACTIAAPAQANESENNASYSSLLASNFDVLDDAVHQSRDTRFPSRGSTGNFAQLPSAPRLPTASRLPQPLPTQSLPQIPNTADTGVDFQNPQPLPQQFPDASLPNGGFPEDDFRRDDFRQQRGFDGDLFERCRRDNGVGGALIGGAIGGLAGNRIAGRGNRTAGTLIGAGVGAIAGTVIDQAERDPCDNFRQPRQQQFADYNSYYAAYNQWLSQYYAAYTAQYNAYVQAVAQAGGSTTTVTVTGGCGCHQPQYVTEEVYVEQPRPVKRVKRTKAKRLRRTKARPASR